MDVARFDRQLKRRASKTIMIGDTVHDLEMALAASTRAVAVSYGAHQVSELQACNPEAVFEDTPSLADWLISQVHA